MMCRNCGNDNAWHSVSRYNSESEAWEECCNTCGLEGGGEAVPDVYLGRIGQTFQALCDERGVPIPIQSKRHKKEVMDKLGVREHPDRLVANKSWIEGTREVRRKGFDKDRPMIRETLRRYQERNRG